jgi:hypothetical protein
MVRRPAPVNGSKYMSPSTTKRLSVSCSNLDKETVRETCYLFGRNAHWCMRFSLVQLEACPFSSCKEC